MSEEIDPTVIDRLLAGHGLGVVNVAPLAGGYRFTVRMGPATARYGGIEDGLAAVLGAGYRASFTWAGSADRTAGYGRAFIDVTR